jgi:hypothetical protein
MKRFSFDFLARKFRATITEQANLRRKRVEAKQLTDEEKVNRKLHLARIAALTPVMQLGPGYIRNHMANDSRQVRHRRMRLEMFKQITERFPGELRKVRRSMAFDSLRRVA